MLDTVHGFGEGDRVRDTRTNQLGTVHIFETDPADAGEDVAQAEVQWDGSFVACELDLVLPHLQRHRD